MGIALAFCVSILVVASESIPLCAHAAIVILFAARFSISPAQTGLALSYILSVQQACAHFMFCLASLVLTMSLGLAGSFDRVQS